ncbi:MAG TPA: UDP-glucuronosyltransferase [Thermoanaerobaculia bacterium]|jgi:hypothetical protein
MEPRVTVLGSGVALGVYVPALLAARQLARHGVDAEALVVESLYTAAGLDMLERYRQAYHRDFSLALMGHRMTRDVRPSLDAGAVTALLDRWRAEDRRYFSVWSGFWMPVLERYRREALGPLSVDLCRIDAEISATFKIYQDLCDGLGDEAREIWLWSLERRKLIYELPVSDQPALPWSGREDRLVVHGGGWGIGTYLDRVPELEAAGLALDVVVHDPAEAGARENGRRYFQVDPAWRAWQEERCRFPPFGELREPVIFHRREERHEIYDLLRGSRAIVSKPGGGTLIDSLASATPVVLLEPYGYAEEANAEIWEHLGFGVPMARWQESGFSLDLLERLHRNLLARPGAASGTIDYPASLAARLHDRAA